MTDEQADAQEGIERPPDITPLESDEDEEELPDDEDGDDEDEDEGDDDDGDDEA